MFTGVARIFWVGGTQCLNFEAPDQSGSSSEGTPVNHSYASPCMVTAPALERYATTSPYRPVLHVDWPPVGGRGLARGCGRWLGSVLLGLLLDSDVSESSYWLVCEISVMRGWSCAYESETWTCCHGGKDQPWRQIKADVHCKLSIRRSYLLTYSTWHHTRAHREPPVRHRVREEPARWHVFYHRDPASWIYPSTSLSRPRVHAMFCSMLTNASCSRRLSVIKQRTVSAFHSCNFTMCLLSLILPWEL